MTNYIDRMLDERSELVLKAQRLHEFISGNPTFNELSTIDQDLMVSQRYVMHLYIDLLTKRIEQATTHEVAGRS